MDFPEYLKGYYCEKWFIYLDLDNKKEDEKDYYYKLMNLEERYKLPENLQDYFIECDKKFLPEIISTKYNIANIKFMNKLDIEIDDYKINPRLKELEDNYKLEIQKIYDKASDKLFLEKAKIKIEEQDEKISLLNDEINNMKKIIETIKDNLNLNYQYY